MLTITDEMYSEWMENLKKQYMNQYGYIYGIYTPPGTEVKANPKVKSVLEKLDSTIGKEFAEYQKDEERLMEQERQVFDGINNQETIGMIVVKGIAVPVNLNPKEAYEQQRKIFGSR